MTAVTENYKSIDDLPEATLRISGRLFHLPIDFENIQKYGEDLEKDVQINPKDVTNALELVITQLPAKMTAWAAITRVIGVRKPMFVSDMINIAQAQISSELGKGNSKVVKFWLRYLASLANLNMVNPNHLMLLLEMLLGVANEPNTPLPKADGFVYLVLATLPWTCEKLHAEVGLDLAKLMAFVSSFMSSRDGKKKELGLERVSNAISVYRNVEESRLYEKADCLQILWSRIQNLEVEGWKVGILKTFKNDFGSPYTPLPLPLLVLPEDGMLKKAHKFNYQPKFFIFDDNVDKEIAQVPPMRHISRFILEDTLADIIQIYSLNHLEASKILLNTQDFLAADYFENFNVYQSLVEALITEMVSFPKPDEKIVYYSTLLMDLCKGELKKVPSAMGRALKIIFERMDLPREGMDVECIRRLSVWFSHHLSNFGFSWKWKDWISELEDADTGKVVFVRETLRQCIQLSYYDRVKSVLPQEYMENGQVFPSQEPGFEFKYSDASSSGSEKVYEISKEMFQAMGRRESKDNIAAIINKVKEISVEYTSHNSMDVDMPDKDQVAREIFLQCLMHHGSKSFSHLLSMVERYLSIIQELSSLPLEKNHMIRVIFSFWNRNTQFLQIVLDKFMNYRILDPSSIITWVLSSQTLNDHHNKFFVWSILRTTLNKVLFKVAQIYEKLNNVKNNNNYMMQDDESETVQSLEASYEAAVRERKETFILVFNKFVEVINEKFSSNSQDEILPSSWWRWVSGNMREIGRYFQNDVMSLKVTLELICFPDDTNPHIREIWEEMKACNDFHEKIF